MRALLSLSALLIVLFLVMKLSGMQLQALGPTAQMTPGAAGAASTAAQRSADQVVRALEQGAAARAADAASR